MSFDELLSSTILELQQSLTQNYFFRNKLLARSCFLRRIAERLRFNLRVISQKLIITSCNPTMRPLSKGNILTADADEASSSKEQLLNTKFVSNFTSGTFSK